MKKNGTLLFIMSLRACKTGVAILFIIIIFFSVIVYAESKITQKHVEMLKSENPEERAKTIEKIVKANDKSGCFYLIEALKDKSRIVVKKAIIGLSEIGDSSALKPLMNISAQFKDQELQRLAMKAVDKITSRVSTESGFSSVEEKRSINDKFFRISSGYHKESLMSLNNLTTSLLNNAGYSSSPKEFSGDTVPIRLDFGYRFNGSAGIGGIGYIPEISINTKWNDGSTGEMTLSSYFFEFNYRQYLVSDYLADSGDKEGSPVKKFFPYISGGLGFYFVNFKINDRKIPILSPIGIVYNPETSGSQIGLNLTAGAEFFIYKKLSIDIQGGYLYAKIPEISYSAEATGSKMVFVDPSGKAVDVDLSGVYFLIGVNFYIL